MVSNKHISKAFMYWRNEGFGKLDIEPVQMAAVETIIDYCKRQADKWEGRAEDMEEML